MLIFQSSKILVVVSTILLVLAVVNCAEHSETVDEVADHNKDQEHHDAEPDVAHKKQAGAGTEVSNDEDDYDTETDQTAVEDESSGHVAAKNEPVVAAAEISTNKKSSSSSDHQNNEFNDQNEETEEDGYGGTDEDGQEGGTGDDEEEEETNDTEDFSDDDVDKMNTLNANTNDIVPIPAQGGGSGGQIYQSHRSKLLSIITKPGILAGIVGGAIIGILTAILLIMFIVYRMRKKDEGSYALEESKKPLNAYDYRHVPTKEFYA